MENSKELEPLAREARKYKTAEEFQDNLRNVLENRLPDLREKFSELQRVTTRIKGKRGASGKTINKTFDAFRASGKQIQKEVSLALGYKSIEELPYNLRHEIKTLTEQLSFEPTSRRWIDLINKRLSEITKGQKLADFHAQAIKTDGGSSLFDEMIGFKGTFEAKLGLDRSLQAYGAVVQPENVYKATEEFATRQLRGLVKWYEQRLKKFESPAMIVVKTLLKDDIIPKREQLD